MPPCGDYSDADEIHSLSGQVKALTQIACELAKALSGGQRRELSREARAFISRHEEEDRRRLLHEAHDREVKRKRAQVLAKLTPYERGLLGVR